MSSHSEVAGLTETQSIVRNVVFSTRTKTTTEEKSLVSSEFDTKEEAQEWIDKRTDILEEAYEITKEEIITSTIIEQDGKPININEEFDDEKDLLEKKEELESNTNNECDLTVEEKNVCDITETTVEVDEIFDTKEEAEAFIEEKKEEPEKDKPSPKMGDDSNIELYTAVLLASSFGLGTTLGYTIGSQKVKKKKMR